jgi:hypothetical protein
VQLKAARRGVIFSRLPFISSPFASFRVNGAGGDFPDCELQEVRSELAPNFNSIRSGYADAQNT